MTMQETAGVPVRDGTLEAGGLHSPVLEAGPAEATEAVVFLHGNPGSSRDWEPLIGRVGAFARAVALDMPGFGQADKPKAGFDYTVGGYASHVAAALGELGITRAHLVLHDFGGPWGLAWAAEHPDAFASVVLLNTGVLIGYRWHYLAKIWRTPVGGDLFMATANRAAFGLLLRHGNHGGLPKPFVDRMYGDFDRGTKRAVLRLYRATGDIRGLSATVTAALAPLRRPALVVWGANDPYIPVEQAENQRQAFDVEDVVLLPDSGHWPFADDPEAVAAAVLPFLERHVQPQQ
jgi:pimeloyl-ACP methyl ester carboxylesterase